MGEIRNIEDIRGEQVSEALRYLGSLVRGYYNSNAYVSRNMTLEQLKLFSYDREPNQLFQANLYHKVLAALITDFINKVGYNQNWEQLELDRDSFLDYIDWYRVNDDVYTIDYDRLRSLMPEEFKHNNEFLIDTYYIVKMIQQSVCTNEQSNYMSRLSEANDFSNRENLKSAITFYDSNKSKKNLLDEFILKTLKRYPDKSKVNQGSSFGMDFVYSYVRTGSTIGLVEDDKLGDRVSRELPREEAMAIIQASDIYAKDKSMTENIVNYIDMVIFGEVLDAMKDYSTDIKISSFNEYMNTGNLTYITRFDRGDKNLNALMVNMSANEIRRFYASLGISNTGEYIEKYFTSKEGPRKG